MRLIDELERLVGKERGLFRARLPGEDIARLRKLQALAPGTADAAAFGKISMRVGWTQGDARTAAAMRLMRPISWRAGRVSIAPGWRS